MWFVRPTCAEKLVSHSVAGDIPSCRQHHQAPSARLHDSSTNQQLRFPVDRSLTAATPWRMYAGQPLYVVPEAAQWTSAMHMSLPYSIKSNILG